MHAMEDLPNETMTEKMMVEEEDDEQTLQQVDDKENDITMDLQQDNATGPEDKDGGTSKTLQVSTTNDDDDDNNEQREEGENNDGNDEANNDDDEGGEEGNTNENDGNEDENEGNDDDEDGDNDNNNEKLTTPSNNAGEEKKESVSPTSESKPVVSSAAASVSSSTNGNNDSAENAENKKEESSSSSTLAASTPAKPVRLRPSLRGHLVREPNGNVKWEGVWGMDDTAFEIGGITSPFTYSRVRIAGSQESNNLTATMILTGEADGSDALHNALFSGHFSMLVNGRAQKIVEKNVLFEFCSDESLPDPTTTIKVLGSGSNKFGHYTLEGTLDLQTGSLNVYREYKAMPLPTAGAAAIAAAAAASSGGNGRGASRSAAQRKAAAVASVSTITPNKKTSSSKPKKSAVIEPKPSASGRTNRIRRMPSHMVHNELDDDTQRDLVQMRVIVRELLRMDREGWFGAPVDAEALGLVDYHKIIKRPMDLGTVLKKLEAKEYLAAEDAIDDVRLTFNNAMKFNPEGTGVFVSARRLLHNFEMQIQNKLNYYKKKKRPSIGGGGGGSSAKRSKKGKSRTNSDVFGSSDDGGNDSDSSDGMGFRKHKKNKSKQRSQNEIDALRAQVHMMTEQIQQMHEMQRQSYEHMLSSQSLPVHQQHISAPPPAAVLEPPKPAKGEGRPLSYQEKRQLGTDINQLPPDKIQGVIQIIQEFDPGLGNGEDDEVELDIESLPTPALKKLQKYVKKALNEARSKKGRGEVF